MASATLAPSLAELRRRLARVPGLTPAAGVLPDRQGRAEQPRIALAELVEPPPLRAHSVGPPEPWSAPVAFLDGVQRYEIAAYAGATPVVLAEVSAAVRERTGREARTVLALRQCLVIGRPEVLATLTGTLGELTAVALGTDEPVHPLGDLDLARAAVDSARGALERRVGEAYRRGSGHWLVVDGSLAESPAWARDLRMIGIAKSHATLPFEGNDLVSYLRLPVGHRSSVFQPASRQHAPVYAWGLRLWDWSGKDLLHGLVRVEAAARPETLALVDTISRWVLAERAPVCGEQSWDRLLYGIHSVGQYLKAARGDR